MAHLKYTYGQRGVQWAVILWKRFPMGSSGTVVCYFLDKAEAKSMAKHLNDTEYLYSDAH